MAEDQTSEGSEPGRLSNETVAERRARLGADRVPPRRRAGWLVLAAAVLVVVVVIVAGFPGPGASRRYPAGALLALVTKINDASHEPGVWCDSPSVPDPARVDWLRGRVVVDAATLPPHAVLADDERVMIASETYASLSCSGMNAF